MPSDVIEAHVRRLPALDRASWTPRPVPRTELERALLAGLVAGWATHPLDNVRGNAQLLLDRDPDKEFGLTGLQDGHHAGRGARPRRAPPPARRSTARRGPGRSRSARGRSSTRARPAAERLRLACERGERVVLATGHPVGLAYLYHELAARLSARGARVRHPRRRGSLARAPPRPRLGARLLGRRRDAHRHARAAPHPLAVRDAADPRGGASPTSSSPTTASPARRSRPASRRSRSPT